MVVFPASTDGMPSRLNCACRFLWTGFCGHLLASRCLRISADAWHWCLKTNPKPFFFNTSPLTISAFLWSGSCSSILILTCPFMSYSYKQAFSQYESRVQLSQPSEHERLSLDGEEKEFLRDWDEYLHTLNERRLFKKTSDSMSRAFRR